MSDDSTTDDRALLERGVDILMIRDNLRASHEVRIARHQNTPDAIQALQ